MLAPDTPGPVAPEHHRVLVVGGGNAGLSVAGRLARYGVRDIAVIEPRSEHRYQPLFSHVAGGTARFSQAHRSQADVMPRGVGWIQDAVDAVHPADDRVVLTSGREVTYDQLIVCPGMQRDWSRVPGLRAAIDDGIASSHYEFELVAAASTALRGIRSGTVVFTQPPGPVSCAGASQKPMYLACDYWRATGVLDDIRVVLIVPDATVFGMPRIDAELNRKLAEYGIELRTGQRLLDVDGEARTIRVGTDDGATGTLAFEHLHAVPPQSAPAFLKAAASRHRRQIERPPPRTAARATTSSRSSRCPVYGRDPASATGRRGSTPSTARHRPT